MGGVQKHPDLLQNKRGGRYKALRIVERRDVTVPPVPEGLHPKAQTAWVTLWSSHLGAAFKETDIYGLERWAWYYSEWCKAVSLPGDRRYVFSCERAMRELEREYGLGAFSRVRLGLTLVEEHKAANALKTPNKPKEMSG